jgi:hypothetical protein
MGLSELPPEIARLWAEQREAGSDEEAVMTREAQTMTRKPGNLFTHRSADFSEDRTYRYALKIRWADGPNATFIGLNPSTADEFQDDPTIRKCKGFASRWGCGGIVMLNLFAYRATKPSDMKKAVDPIGPENTSTYLGGHSYVNHGPTVACWGRHGTFLNRGELIKERVPLLWCLGTNSDGTPCHPLMLPYTTKLIPFNHRGETALELLTNTVIA